MEPSWLELLCSGTEGKVEELEEGPGLGWTMVSPCPHPAYSSATSAGLGAAGFAGGDFIIGALGGPTGNPVSIKTSARTGGLMAGALFTGAGLTVGATLVVVGANSKPAGGGA